jgi:Uma2 family endonuclease
VRVQDTLLVADGFLTIEVAVTSHRRDEAKAARYARAGVAKYWIVGRPPVDVTELLGRPS